jgi:hypothetical protein
MDLSITLGLAALAICAAVACGWMGARPPDWRRGPRLIPYRGLMLLAAVVTLMLGVHLLNLLGFSTGR